MKNIKELKRVRRHKKIRSTLSGTETRPRVVVSKSNTNLFVQAIDDVAEKTLFSISTKSLTGKKIEQAAEAGKKFAELMKKGGIKEIVFDRAGNIYTGRIKALAEGIREGGIKF